MPQVIYTILTGHGLTSTVPVSGSFEIPASPIQLKTIQSYWPFSGNFHFRVQLNIPQIDGGYVWEDLRNIDDEATPGLDGIIVIQALSLDTLLTTGQVNEDDTCENDDDFTMNPSEYDTWRNEHAGHIIVTLGKDGNNNASTFNIGQDLQKSKNNDTLEHDEWGNPVDNNFSHQQTQQASVSSSTSSVAGGLVKGFMKGLTSATKAVAAGAKAVEKSSGSWFANFKKSVDINANSGNSANNNDAIKLEDDDEQTSNEQVSPPTTKIPSAAPSKATHTTTDSVDLDWQT